MEKLLEEFRKNGNAAGSRIYIIQNINAVAASVENLLKAEGLQCLAVDNSPIAREIGDKLVPHRIKIFQPWNGKEVLAKAGDIHIALTTAALGIAETGTIVSGTGFHSAQLLTILPEIHCVILYKDNIIANSEKIPAHLKRIYGKIPGQICFITGPSRTADIERQLTVGVHGPAKLYIFILEEGGKEYAG